MREAAVFVSERASQARRAEERSKRADERLRDEAVLVSEVGAK